MPIAFTGVKAPETDAEKQTILENSEVYGRFFSAGGMLKADMTAELSSNVTVLLHPSPQRALMLNKACRVIVAEQSFIYGRDANVTPATNVHKQLDEGQSTKVNKEVNSVRWYQQ